jgi:hypothetical protein
MKMEHWRDSFQAAAPWSALLACAALVATDIAVVAATPGYSPASETPSQLMTPDVKYSAVMRAGLFAYAVLLLPSGLWLARSLNLRRPLGLLVTGGIAAHIAFSAAVALLLNDSGSAALGGVTANIAHDVSAKVMFCAAVAVVAGTAVSSGPPASSRLRWVSYAAATAMALAGTGFATGFPGEFSGAYERVAAAIFMAWIAAAPALARGERGHGGRYLRARRGVPDSI